MRKWLAFLLMGMFLCSGALADGCAVNAGGLACVFDDDASLLISPGIYDALYQLDGNGNLYAAEKAGAYGVVDADGAILLDFLYQEIRPAENGFLVRQGNDWRYLVSNRAYDGETFSALADAGEGRVLALTGNLYDDIADPLFLLYPDGISFDTGIRVMNGLNALSENRMPVISGTTMKYGYIDADGAWAVQPSFLFAGPFENGLAVVCSTDGYGVINTSGAYVLTPSLAFLTRSDSLFVGATDDTLFVFDQTAKPLWQYPLNGRGVRLCGNAVALTSGDGTLVLREDGSLLTELSPASSLLDCGDGFLIVRSGAWDGNDVLLTDEAGAPRGDPCTALRRLTDGMLAYGLRANGKLRFGLMSLDGQRLTHALYEAIVPIPTGRFWAVSNGEGVVLDANGTILSLPVH